MEQVGSPDILAALWQLVVAVGALLVGLLALAVRWSLLLAWIAWWLWGVNWGKAWPYLARGGWAPVALLLVVSALVWSRLAPGDCSCLVLFTVSNFWWQLGAVGLLAAVALFCGWLQGVFGWAPVDVNLEPPAVSHTHGHEHPVGTFHGHEFAHSEDPAH